MDSRAKANKHVINGHGVDPDHTSFASPLGPNGSEVTTWFL